MVPKMDGVLFSGQSIYKCTTISVCTYIYTPLVNIQKPMENHHFFMDKSTINHYIYIHLCGIAPLAASYV